MKGQPQARQPQAPSKVIGRCYSLLLDRYFPCRIRGLSDMDDRRFRRLSLTRRAAGGVVLAGALALSAGAASAGAASASTAGAGAAGAAVARPGPPRIVYAVTYARDSALYRLSPRSHTVRLEGHAGIFITDITFRRTVLYGISFTALYRLNAATGARRRVGPLGLDGANALATQPGTGVLYGASHQGELFTISTRTGRASLVGAFGHRLGSAGDLTFARGRLYATVSRPGSRRSFLATVSLRTGTAMIIGTTGYNKVWGLVTGSRALYGATVSGYFLAISPTTGRARVIWRDGLPISGLAAPSR